MRKVVVAAIVLSLVSLAGPSGSWAKPAPTKVEIDDPSNATWHFNPREITVKPGSTVIWHNAGTQTHTVTAYDQSFNSGDVAPGRDWSWTFSAPGTFKYHCTPHPWMEAVVHVQP